MEEAERLAEEHWEYIEGLLSSHYNQSTDINISFNKLIEIVGFHYKSAMIHGYKHAMATKKSIDDFKRELTTRVDCSDVPVATFPGSGSNVKYGEGSGHD